MSCWLPQLNLVHVCIGSGIEGHLCCKNIIGCSVHDLDGKSSHKNMLYSRVNVDSVTTERSHLLFLYGKKMDDEEECVSHAYVFLANLYRRLKPNPLPVLIRLFPMVCSIVISIRIRIINVFAFVLLANLPCYLAVNIGLFGVVSDYICELSSFNLIILLTMIESVICICAG